MSFIATDAAWKYPNLSPRDRYVLIGVAHRANAAHEAWPSQKRLARDTGLSERTIRTSLLRLDRLGVIRRTARIGAAGRTSDLISLEPLILWKETGTLARQPRVVATDAPAVDRAPPPVSANDAATPGKIRPLPPAASAAESNKEPQRGIRKGAGSSC